MKSDLVIVDTHAHFAVKENKSLELSLAAAGTVPDYKKQKGFDDLEYLKKMVGAGGDGFVDENNMLEDYLACMDENQIAMSWVHQLSFEDVYGYEVLSNEKIAEAVRAHPDKLRGFASVNPYKGKEALAELDYAIKTLGMQGFKLNPNDYGGFVLNDRDLLYPLYERCSELGVPVSVHTGITPGSIFRMKHNYPILLDDVAVDFPDLTLIVEHMGHPWNDLCYYMVGRHDNMYVTITAVANILIHNNPKVFRMELAKMISVCGSHKILWGSDWTVTPNIAEVLNYMQKVVIPLPMKLMMGVKEIKREDVQNILGRNALRIMK
ncbi:amidohydrolase family protein [Paenibacillus sp. FSL R7-0204]|uniref:amidohydrolase family protein n=1 Tax=Paenibacillus sp. FSL R7-0204 TaxID=2921675 RepID=UPI0030F6E8E9